MDVETLHKDLEEMIQLASASYSHVLADMLTAKGYEVLGQGYTTVTLAEGDDSVVKIVHHPNQDVLQREVMEKLDFLGAHISFDSLMGASDLEIRGKYLFYRTVRLEPISEALSSELGYHSWRKVPSKAVLLEQGIPEAFIPALVAHFEILPGFLSDIKPANIMKHPNGTYIVIDASRDI